MLFHLLILALASALAAPASAQMFKCVGADGRATYKDRPCDARTKQTDVESRMTGRAPVIRYYEIYSKDWAGMRNEIDQKGPKGFHGFANWKVSYNYRYNTSAGGQCSITSLVPQFEGEILLPHWVPGPDVSATQRQQWDRFIAALKVHEDGHIDHGTKLSAALAQLSGMQAPSCGEAESQVKKRADELIQRYSAMDAEYDRDTNHGATQGASLQR
jgi:predicted secreted Zn-dependent protease